MNKRHYEHTLPNIRGSLSNTYSEDAMNGIYRQLVNGRNICNSYVLRTHQEGEKR